MRNALTASVPERVILVKCLRKCLQTHYIFREVKLTYIKVFILVIV